MQTGIQISRGIGQENPPGQVKLNMLFNLIEVEFARTKILFGKSKLRDLKLRLLAHVLALSNYEEPK
jgi:hypothetical protein